MQSRAAACAAQLSCDQPLPPLRATSARLVHSEHSLWRYASASAKENRAPLATPLAKRIAAKRARSADNKTPHCIRTEGVRGSAATGLGSHNPGGIHKQVMPGLNILKGFGPL